MRKFTKPNVVISRCIEFDNCRYDGGRIQSDFVNALKPYVEFIPICPEVEIGLGVPRKPIRIVSIDGEKRLIQPATNLDLTEKMKELSSRFLSNLSDADGFILKSRSPSCGIRDIAVYAGTNEEKVVSKTSGIFAGSVIESFFGYPLEDENGLKDLDVREHFLTRLFAIAGFRAVTCEDPASGLVKYHFENELLFGLYDRNEAIIMRSLAANDEKLDHELQTQLYREHLLKALRFPPKHTSKFGVFMLIYGHLSKKIPPDEKSNFLINVELYEEGKISSQPLMAQIRSWIARFEDYSLLEQTFFEPFPMKLIMR